jgi:hypothetical protein
MIYGEIVQRWRIADGAVMQKWPQSVEKYGAWFLYVLRHPHVGGDDLSSKNAVFLKIGVFQNSQTIQFGRIVYDLEGQFTMFIGYE